MKMRAGGVAVMTLDMSLEQMNLHFTSTSGMATVYIILSSESPVELQLSNDWTGGDTKM